MKLLPESPVEFLEPLSRPPERVYAAEMETPYGPLALAGEGEALLRVHMRVPLPRFIHDLESEWGAEVRIDEGPFRPVMDQLEAYFSGDSTPIRAVVRPWKTSPFYQEVHRILTRIPFGSTITYRELAILAGRPGAARAAGSGCGRNHVLIIVPCHRIVAAHGLGGFGAGLDLKELLLRHEGVFINSSG